MELRCNPGDMPDGEVKRIMELCCEAMAASEEMHLCMDRMCTDSELAGSSDFDEMHHDLIMHERCCCMFRGILECASWFGVPWSDLRGRLKSEIMPHLAHSLEGAMESYYHLHESHECADDECCNSMGEKLNQMASIQDKMLLMMD